MNEGEVFHEFFAPGNIAAATCERLAQRAHPHVDVSTIDVEVLADSAPRLAENADRVRLVDHKERPVAIANLDELRKIRVIAVHTIDAFEDD